MVIKLQFRKSTERISRVFLLLFLFISPFVFCQLAPNIYWVQFTDKHNSPYLIDKPEDFLSERALFRREKQNIRIDSTDLPVNPQYVDSIQSLGLKILNTSRWFNGVTVHTYNSDLLDSLHHLSFVAKPIVHRSILISEKHKKKFQEELTDTTIAYGECTRQIEMLNAQTLHKNGFMGDGILIAVLDAGFGNTDIISGFNHLWENEQIISTRDFVHDGKNFFQTHNHGTNVLSVIGGYIKDKLSGISPAASFVLLRTENDETEYLVEEYNWISGAEFADSIGADIINSSLGYSDFDIPEQNHAYSDLDGKTTPISIGAGIASSKGILVVNSAGNEGSNSWGRIIAPGDAKNILTVGAVDSLKAIASFSSYGPSHDGRIKPEVVAMGKFTTMQSVNGDIIQKNGTSFSAPLISGAAACLWQANPEASNLDIIEAILKSSNRFNQPDSLYGFGVPDLYLANLILQNKNPEAENLTQLNIFPNPASEYTYISLELPWLTKKVTGYVLMLDICGRIISQEIWELSPGSNLAKFDISGLPNYAYYNVIIYVQERVYNAPLLKTKPL